MSEDVVNSTHWTHLTMSQVEPQLFTCAQTSQEYVLYWNHRSPGILSCFTISSLLKAFSLVTEGGEMPL